MNRPDPDMFPFDFGSDVYGSWFMASERFGPERRNLMWTHKRVGTDRSCGSYWIDLMTGTKHRLESEDPLTISPSILCPVCGLHGYIREGRWVSA